MKRPKGVAGPGLQPVWLGPYVISCQVGEHSFEILIGKETMAVHSSQLKICVEVGLGEEVLDYGAVVRPFLGVESRDSQIGQCSSEARSVAQFSPRRPSSGVAYVDPAVPEVAYVPRQGGQAQGGQAQGGPAPGGPAPAATGVAAAAATAE